ncbi:unnamed protein product [Fraxinus pennsylvanica]|uniref:Uncharacterized protein n=1 Tax=Fraxinus pennsylvanica TaxID=56036 RepID=A0AAD1YP27_9LAMI|nr:unnamed protein product [Fraxinus pennsylvanica]
MWRSSQLNLYTRDHFGHLLKFFNDDLSWYDLFSPEFEVEKPANWTAEENKMFENSLAEVDPDNPAFIENSGVYPIPKYETDDQDNRDKLKVSNEKESPSPATKKTCNGQLRRRGVPWTEDEHQYFLTI